MDPRLLKYYDQELAYIRAAAKEFGEDHPSVAARLGLDNPADPDPYVERLLEGFAFLTARVQLKLSDEFANFTQALLSSVHPMALAPTPSMGVVALEPNDELGELMNGVTVPAREPLIVTPADGETTPCRFRTGHPVTLWPITLEKAEYTTSRPALSAAAAAVGRASETLSGLRLTFRADGPTSLGALPITHLDLHAAGRESTPGLLYELCVGRCVGAAAKTGEAGVMRPVASTSPIEPIGFSDGEALLPPGASTFRGYRLFQEYFACPERFHFFRLSGLDHAFAGAGKGESVEVTLLFRTASEELQGRVDADSLRLYATPVVNLFETQAARIETDGLNHEHRVSMGGARPNDFEIHSVLDVQAYEKSASKGRQCLPLYHHARGGDRPPSGAWYTTRRTARRLSKSERERRAASDYVGTETYLQLASAQDTAEDLSWVAQLSVRVLASNRDLPHLMRFAERSAAFEFESAGHPVNAVRVERAPSAPRAPDLTGDGLWRLVDHLLPNYLDLAAPLDGEEASGFIRRTLRAFGRPGDAAGRREADAIARIGAEPALRRVNAGGRRAFVTGQRVRVELETAGFAPGRMFAFSAVLGRFLAEFSPVNAFVESVITTRGGEEVAEWPAQIGLRPTI